MARIDLVPNSPEWLDELEKLNTMQAVMTRAVIASRDGNEEVCQVCGDAPAKDYVVPGFPLRGRFCDTCRATQDAM
jgi:hypothetical protein